MESGGNPPGKEVIQLGITNSNKVINVDRIDCSGSLRVTLALTAAPDIISNPTDIVWCWIDREVWRNAAGQHEDRR